MSRPLKRLSGSAAVIACACLTLQVAGSARQAPSAPQRPTFTASTEAWWVTATVTGPDGHLMTDLTKDDFEVRDNGEVRPITAFRSDRIPFAIVAMFDLSNSMQENFGVLRRAMGELVTHFEPGDRANIGTFDTLPYLSPRFSGNPATIRSWVTASAGGAATVCSGDFMTDNDQRSLLDRVKIPGATAIWDAVDCAINTAASDGETPRRVVLLVTDGMDNVSTDTPDEVVQDANEDGVMIYGILMHGDDPGGTDRDAVKSLADATGGGFFVLNQMSDMGATFARIAEELRHQYVFGFSPAAGPDSKHRIEVKVLRPGSATRARRVYMTLNPLRTPTLKTTPPAAAAPPAPSGPPLTIPPSSAPGARTTTGAAGGGLSLSLDQFERGDWSIFDAAPPTPEELQGLLRWLRANAATWSGAAGPADEHHRRFVLATFVLQLLNTEQDPFLWFGGGAVGSKPMDPGHWSAGFQSHTYDQPLPATELLQWAAAFLKAEPSQPAERWWHLGAIALLEREHATEALSFEADSAHARFPSEDRYVLASAIAQEDLTWPQIRDGRALLVDPAVYVAIADRYREASTRESVKSEAELRMGFFELRRGHPDTALSHFAQVGTPPDPVLRYWLGLFKGEALEESGHGVAAIASYEGAFKEAPYAQSAAFALAAALEHAHRAPEAAVLTSRTLTARPAPIDPWSIYTFPDIRFWPRVTQELRAAVTVTK